MLVKQGEKMIENYAVVFLNKETWETRMDIFSESSEGKAKHAFHECYRHCNYKVLSVTKIPEHDN